MVSKLPLPQQAGPNPCPVRAPLKDAQKKASTWLASAISCRSIGFCGCLYVVRDKRDQGILLAMGELTKTLQQFAFVQ